MENQTLDRPQRPLNLSLLTGCGTSLAAFVAAGVCSYALDIWLLPGESLFFILLIGGFGCGLFLALVTAAAAGMAVFRAKKSRPLAFGLLSWAGSSLLMNIAITGIGNLAERYAQALTNSTEEMFSYFGIIRVSGLILLLAANVLALLGGWLVYRHQTSKQG
jgi:hypothetical protein